MKKILTFALVLAPSLAANVANAQPADVNAWGYDDFSTSNIALGSKPLRETIGGVINIILGFLGILTTLIILFGGFKWMTSYGSSEKVDEAKKLIGAGVVGLVIILTAYAVSRFVLSELFAQTVD
ncbi:MAG: hypothetical protein HOE19_03280 [Candidatus Komeilibacteria bacterium]|jgi:hypothetical protein|nr:hypothetical protein [Candidatus Komeilibacteria bacterium]MBT4447700.1 hypothetical protein [Candidatus Komeilibacteria bacterium]